MAHLQVEDGGDGYQIWRMPVNILNELLCTAYKELGGRPTSPHQNGYTGFIWLYIRAK